MAQNTKNINKRKTTIVKEKNHHFFLFFIIFLIICAAVVCALIFLDPFGNKKSSEQQAVSNSETQSNDKSSSSDSASSDKKEETTSTEPTEHESEKENTQYEGNNPNTLETITGIVSFAGISEGNFVVTVAIDQALGSSGTCAFTITNGSDTTISASAATSAGPSASFCTYSIPASSVGSGKYSISVKVAASGKEGMITGEANI